MQIEISADELAFITAHYNNQIAQARETIAKREEYVRAHGAKWIAGEIAMGFTDPAQEIAEANEIIAYATARIDHYSPIIAAAKKEG